MRARDLKKKTIQELNIELISLLREKFNLKTQTQT